MADRSTQRSRARTPVVGIWDVKAELIPADALRFQLKAGGTLEVIRGDPKPPCFFVGRTDLACSVVVDDNGMGLPAPGRNTGHRKQETEESCDTLPAHNRLRTVGSE